MTRARLNDGGGAYFSVSSVEVFSSGCPLLDCVLGGGWGVGKIANIVGDSSTGKTLLAIEACANFHRKYPDGKIFYIEAEAAFDDAYAQSVGFPESAVRVADIYTIEDLHEKIEEILPLVEERGLIVIDSLDALSTRAELQRKLDQATFGADKARQLSQVFRRVVQKLDKKNITTIVISQLRDNIGVTFGETKTASGGRALKYYCSQIVWLSQLKKRELTRKGIQRVVGIDVKALCKKNKLGPPFRDCEFPIIFAYGIDDVTAALNWLHENGKGAAFGVDSETGLKAKLKSLSSMDNDAYFKLRDELRESIVPLWKEIEVDFQPPRTKYQS